MENKINIAELLKDCPNGMGLYSPMFGTVYFEGIKDTGIAILIEVTTSCNSIHHFYPDGKYNTYYSDSECLLFPSKENRDWSKFQRPFKDGDIVTYRFGGSMIACIYKKRISKACINSYFVLYTGCMGFSIDQNLIIKDNEIRLATEDEKQKLFDAIKDNGYRWNGETKTLVKLPRFKVGDRVKHISAYTSGIIVKVDDTGYYIDYPKGEGVCYISFTLEKDYELAPNKFDINTLKPFESRVLVRSTDEDIWRPATYGFTDSDRYYVVGGIYWKQCIPYKENEHLRGTTNDCDKFYKTWE